MALARKGYSPLRAVGVVVTDGRVSLHGRVPSFHLKQVAQEAARVVPGGSGLVNRLAVDSRPDQCLPPGAGPAPRDRPSPHGA